LTLQPHTIPSLTGVLILPVVTLIVISATGAVVCNVIPPTSGALHRTMLGSYAAWAIGFPLANVLLALYFLRLMVYKVVASDSGLTDSGHQDKMSSVFSSLSVPWDRGPLQL
jgi:tellurite resistance protein TehA-like permease